MKLNKKIVWVVEAVGLFLIFWSVVGIAVNTGTLSEVTVTLKTDRVEHRDKTILGVGNDDEAPDYQLRVKAKGRWKDLGTYGNSWVREGLTFKPNENIPMHEVTEIQLLDLDKLESDLLEQVPVGEESYSYSGNNYVFQVATTNEVESGFAWFFTTPIGIAILTGITIGVVIIVLAALA